MNCRRGEMAEVGRTISQDGFMPRLAISAPMRLRGLLGRAPAWLGPCGVLVLAPCSSIHTFGMRLEIDVAFLDGSGTVLGSFARGGPRRMLRCPGACAVLERFSDAGPPETRPPWPEAGQRLGLALLHAKP